MVCYECNVCSFTTKLKGNYKQHLKTKKHMNNTNQNVITVVKSQKEPEKSQKEPIFFCSYCNMEFSTYANKRRHEIHRCKKNSSINEKKIKELEKEKKKLEKKIEKMLDTACTINNTTNNTTNNIIVVNNYGNENTDYLTVNKIEKLLNRPYDSIQELIKMLHFNNSHPENHNVKITNKKEPYALVWNDPIWELRKKKTVVKDLVDKGYMILDTTHEDISNPNKKYIKFQSNYEDSGNTIKDKIEEEAEIMIVNESKKI